MVNTLGESSTFAGRISFPVYYEDTDLSGFVYHANYLKFFERAREHLIGIGYLKELWDQGVHFVVSEASLKYLRPARLGDELEIRTQVSFNGSPVLNCQQLAGVQGNASYEEFVRGQITLVTLNQHHKPIRLPKDVLGRFKIQSSSAHL